MADEPNLIFIIADDHRFDAMSVAGDPVIRTPVLDRLATEGAWFSHAHTMGGLNGAVCVPSRATILSGCSPMRCPGGPRPSGRRLDPDRALWPERLRRAGWHTHGIGKWHNEKPAFQRCFESGEGIFFGGMGNPFNLPLHDYDPAGEYPSERARRCDDHATDVLCDAGGRFIREQADADGPFCLYLALTSPHDPRTAPPPWSDMYDPAEMPLPPNFMPEHPFDNGELEIRDELLAGMPRRKDEIRRHMADYAAMISHMDAAIGRVLDALDETGQAENTIVVYTGDHGLAVGRHGLMGKQNLYDHSIRIPLIMRGPGISAGQEIDGMVSNIDVHPTLLELCGLSVASDVEGVSLKPILDGQTQTVRHNVYAMYSNLHRTVSDGQWKLIRYWPDDQAEGEDETGSGETRWQLFNLQSDPWELNDLAGRREHEDQALRLAQELVDWQERDGDFLSTDTPALVRATS
ncbi:MAG: sulfatase-like hydrolase/transferase [Phycisphaeraceae bacterium]|nr:sulfatase-like hydrolase/transferase [Phycisphaeraceae bacterium]